MSPVDQEPIYCCKNERTHALLVYFFTNAGITGKLTMIGKPRKRPAPACSIHSNGVNDVNIVATNSSNISVRSHRHRYRSPSSVPKSLLGLFQGGKTRKFLSSGKNRWSKATYILGVAIIVFGCGFLLLYLKTFLDDGTTIYTSRQGIRRTTTVNRNFAILLQPKLLQPTVHNFVLPHYQPKNNKHKYGLNLRFLDSADFSTGRMIYTDPHESAGYDELWNATDDDGDWESYYAFDDDENRNPMNMYDDPDIHLRKKCRRTSWHREQPLSCNIVHEYDFQNHIQDGDTTYVGRGYYRNVYLTTPVQADPIILKTIRWHYDFTYEEYEYIRMDALVSEKLNGHDEIVHSYAFCGTSIIGEAFLNGNLFRIAIPLVKGRGIKVDYNSKNLTVRNELSGSLKLEWSLQMAKAVQLLHSYPGGVIVHDDIQLTQFLISSTGSLKLNDFNRAEVMLWDEQNGEYCKYRNYEGRGDWRSPEEYFDKPLDEKIDIWSLGNNMYSLLTGMYPFAEISDDEEEQLKEKIKDGFTAFIDPRFLLRSFAEAKLSEIIRLCWIYEPNQRIDIFQLVNLLENAIRENNLQQNKDTPMLGG